MSERARNGLIAVALLAMAGTLAFLVFSAPTDQDRVGRIGASIMCPVCQGEAIANSPSQMARDMMALVEERVAAGATDAQIIDELLSSYSGALLLDPPLRGPTLVLWVAPVVALLAGIGVIAWWRRHPSPEVASGAPIAPRGRKAVGALFLIAALAATVMLVGFFLQEREGPAGGLAGIAIDDLDEVSNRTLEAVVASNRDHPQIDGMRLALADRYFRDGDYRSAFPHYLTVAESPLASSSQVAGALTALGWMAWDGNRQAETAIGLFDQALTVEPASTTALYLKSQVVWCGLDDPDRAVDLLTAILETPNLPDGTRALVSADLAALGRGEGCT